jgi:hypothetical protein
MSEMELDRVDQAIQAASAALIWQRGRGLPDPKDAARIAVEAATPYLLRDAQELIRDLLHHTETWHHHPPTATCRKCIVQKRAQAALDRAVAPELVGEGTADA